MITGDMTVARLLDEHPELLDVLAGFHPHFQHLRNRLLRRLMAPRVSLVQAARIAGAQPEEMLAVLRAAVGEAAGVDSVPTSAPASPDPALARPAVLDAVPESRRVLVDVRDDIRRGVEPFARIMTAVKALAVDEVFVLRAPFEPIPLYDVLGKRGFEHWTECRGAEDWWVTFYRGGAGETSSRAERAEPAAAAARTIDVRGLEPPQPMVRVLESLDALPAGGELIVLHERRPMFLYPQLDERGFVHETDEPQPGVVRIRIRHANGGVHSSKAS
jgi:uncharacterized protein (DUF2249 family)